MARALLKGAALKDRLLEGEARALGADVVPSCAHRAGGRAGRRRGGVGVVEVQEVDAVAHLGLEVLHHRPRQTLLGDSRLHPLPPLVRSRPPFDFAMPDAPDRLPPLLGKVLRLGGPFPETRIERDQGPLECYENVWNMHVHLVKLNIENLILKRWKHNHTMLQNINQSYTFGILLKRCMKKLKNL